MQTLLVFRNAQLVHSKSRTELEFLTGKAVLVQNGAILDIVDEPCKLDQYQHKGCTIVEEDLSNKQFLMPGLIDTHAHAPQFAFTGSGLDLSLLDWLNKYTYPCESKFANLDYARSVYQKSVETHLRSGTTTICYYGTIHLAATQVLVSLMRNHGMRGFVGKVCMDQDSPNWYREASAEQSLHDTKEFINWFHANDTGLVRPIVTPRFAISCSRALMQGLGKIAKDEHVPIQTHLSESQGEIALVHTLYPDAKSYASLYDECGLLTPETVLAHCIYLSEPEIQLVIQRRCGISHCPVSNVTLSSGIMPTREYLDRGMKLGLGTDVAGGYTTSMFEAIRSCVGMSKLQAVFQGLPAQVTLAEAFYMATQGGAEVLGLQTSVGTLEKGKRFDALLVDYSQLNGYVDAEASLADLFEKVVYLMDDRNIRSRWIDGQKVNLPQK